MMQPALHETIGDQMEAIRHFWYDLALSVSAPQLAALLAVADPSRITFGTDFPMAPSDQIASSTAAFAGDMLTSEQRLAFGRGNAALLFGRRSHDGSLA